MDRSYLSKCLAKAIAYALVGKKKDAGEWLANLVEVFNAHGIYIDDTEE